MAGDPPLRILEDGLLDVVALITNPATSTWLLDALATAFERDPFDAERDALTLATILTRRVDALVDRHFATRC